jgi:YVTN family beta-propeller protein
VEQGIVTGTIYLKVPLSGGNGTSGGEPMDVVFSGNAAYVSISRANQIAVIDTTTQTLVATIPLFGDSPRAMAVSPDGSTVYAAFALAGNATTLIPNTAAPPPCGTAAQGRTPCVPAMNPALPPAPQVGLIVAASNPTWYPSFIKYTMPDNGVAAIKTGGTPIRFLLLGRGNHQPGSRREPGQRRCLRGEHRRAQPDHVRTEPVRTLRK